MAERTALIDSLKQGHADALERARDYSRQMDDRIAAGTLVPLGGDRYRVNDPSSWDNGEVWTYRRVAPNVPALILPEHGLDETTGKVALYTRVPRWHSLGNVIPEGLTDPDEILEAGGIGFQVIQRKARFLLDGDMDAADDGWDIAAGVVPGMFVNLRDDTMAPLGIVGSRYVPFQNRQAYGFLQELVGDFGVICESAGATHNGAHVFMSVKLPESMRIDKDGIDDEIVMYVVIVNTHDGSGLFRAVATPWCPACGNTERFALRDAVTSWGIRHTKSAPERAKEARKVMRLTFEYMDAFQAEEEALARNEMLIGEFTDLMREMYPREDDENSQTKTKRDNREDQIMECWRVESDRVGRTAYGAERALTNYWDNVVSRKTGGNLEIARATAVIEGSDDDKKTRAHKLLMQRVS